MRAALKGNGMRKCLKCGAVNDAARGDPTEACPSCGAIYSKVSLASAQAKAGRQRRASSARKTGTYVAALLAAGGVLFCGYLIWEARARATDAREATVVREIAGKFGDAFKLAQSTSRIALATPISQMQEIRREAAALELGKCADAGRDELMLGMQSSIDGFLSFMGREDGAPAFATGSVHIKAANEALTTCGKR